MQTIAYVFLSLLFTIPFAVLCSLLYLPIHVDPEYCREIYASIPLFLLLIIWGIYTLILPFLGFFALQKKGPQLSWQQHVREPLVSFFPITLGVGLFLWLYMWMLMAPLKHFTVSPPLEFIHLFGFLLFVAEGFKISQRRWVLKKYRELSQEEFYPLRLSPKTLNALVYAQSPVYLFFFWSPNLLGFYVVDRLCSGRLSAVTIAFVYISLMLVITILIRKAGRAIETYGKIHAYIPWQSKY